MGQLSILGFIAIGGAFGACSRYLISELCVVMLGRGFPYGTLTVNVIGSLIMGLLIAAFENEMVARYKTRIACVCALGKGVGRCRRVGDEGVSEGLG